MPSGAYFCRWRGCNKACVGEVTSLLALLNLCQEHFDERMRLGLIEQRKVVGNG